MRFRETALKGCFEIRVQDRTDERGTFRKVFQRSVFREHGLEVDFQEAFYTSSVSNVLRGMHVQLPPGQHSKLVYCVAGSVMDVLLDLRRGSVEFGRCEVIDLSASRGNVVYIAPGVAHGFYVLDSPAIMAYHVSSEHVQDLDRGVHWRSLPIEWPTNTPLVSERDSQLPQLQDFVSPFCLGEARVKDANR